MVWGTKRRASDGALLYQGRYRDPFGAKRTVGTFPSHRQALKAANHAEGKVADGTWPPERQLDEVSRLFHDLRNHPRPNPARGPVLGHAAADRAVDVEPIGVQVDA